MTPDILTSGGTYFHFLEPERSAIDIETIAHALAHICRFTGHTATFYSVAQHSVLVSRLVPPEHALAGLLHDAAEAYLGDVAAPLKMLLPDYKTIEARVEAEVLRRFGLPAKLPPEVKQADRLALALEQHALMPLHDDVWSCDRHPGFDAARLHWRIVPELPIVARRLFVARFRELAAIGAQKQESVTPAVSRRTPQADGRLDQRVSRAYDRRRKRCLHG